MTRSPTTAGQDLGVTAVSCAVVRLPLGVPLRHATADVPYLESVVWHIRLADGSTGWAEVRGNGEYATGYDTRDVLAAAAALPPAESDAWSDVPAILAKLATSCPLAAAGLDIAWRDALARALGVPLWRALRRLATDVYPVEPEGEARLATHAQIGFVPPERARELARAAVIQGYRRIKVRVGGAEHVDRERILAVRQAVDLAAGDARVDLVADANGGWDAATAVRAGAWLAEADVAWLEQPVPPGDPEALAAVRRAVAVPIWADESVRSADDVERLARAGAVDGVHLKLEKAGTVEALAAAVATARERGLDIGLGQMDCGRIGCATTTHLALGLGVPVAELWGCANVTRDVAQGPQLQGGNVVLPPAPGLGVRVSADVHARLRPAAHAGELSPPTPLPNSVAYWKDIR